MYSIKYTNTTVTLALSNITISFTVFLKYFIYADLSIILGKKAFSFFSPSFPLELYMVIY